MNWVNYLSLSVAAVVSGIAVAVLVGPTDDAEQPATSDISDTTSPVDDSSDVILQEEPIDEDPVVQEPAVEEQDPVEAAATDVSGFNPGSYANWTFSGEDVIRLIGSDLLAD
jgi:hypothetical protein